LGHFIEEDISDNHCIIITQSSDIICSLHIFESLKPSINNKRIWKHVWQKEDNVIYWILISHDEIHEFRQWTFCTLNTSLIPNWNVTYSLGHFPNEFLGHSLLYLGSKLFTYSNPSEGHNLCQLDTTGRQIILRSDS
jgi:hypothetical protein